MKRKRLEIGKPAVLQVGKTKTIMTRKPIVYLGRETSPARLRFLSEPTSDLIEEGYAYLEGARVSGDTIIASAWEFVGGYYHWNSRDNPGAKRRYQQLVAQWNQAMQPRQEVTA